MHDGLGVLTHRPPVVGYGIVQEAGLHWEVTNRGVEERVEDEVNVESMTSGTVELALNA